MLLDEGGHFLGLYLRTEELNDFALRVQEELREVPRNHFGLFGGGVIETAVVSEVSENRVRVFAIDLNLLHYREACLEVVLHKSIDLLGASTLLSKELVAGEG